MYEWHAQRTIELVLGSSLIASIVTTSALSIFAQRYAFPKRLESMITSRSIEVTVAATFSQLCKKMEMHDVNLNEARVGNAFSLNNRGRKIVAISQELLGSMSSAEIEAVLAHELSHLKNNDSTEKGLARVAKLAFAFDPVLHLVEAAVHRERELLADRSSVRFTQKPLALASALLRVHSRPFAGLDGTSAGLFAGKSSKGLLCKYPDLHQRVQALIDMAHEMNTEVIPA